MERKLDKRRSRSYWKCLAQLLVLAAFFAAVGWFLLPWAFPLPASLGGDPMRSPVLLDRSGLAIRHLVSEDFTRAAPVPIEEIPQRLIDCTLAAEDKRFYKHHGIDFLATARSASDFVRNRRVVSGASTITQQLVKISSPPTSRNLWAKIHEAMLARRLEMSWGKDRILAAYFARLDYGNLRISPTEAARFYFQKPLSDLSLGEAALLAGLPQAPSRLNPIRNPKNAEKRRATVLDRLSRSGRYPASAIAVARAEKINLRPLRETQSAPWLNRPTQFSGEIRTTLDLPLQKDIERIVREETARLKSSNLRHAAVVVIENSTGDILAMVSSADWDDPRGGQLHGALTPRSPGSALKPFTYLLGFRYLNQLPSTIIADIPTRLDTEQGLQLPENYDRKYRGPVTIRTALACSLNVPTLRELDALGGPEKLQDFLQPLGITTLIEPASKYGLGLTLGNAPVKLLELTNAYAAIARSGKFLPSRLFMDREIPEGEQLIDPTDAFLITDILSDKQARTPAFSSGGPLDLPFPCAVKTGTSSDFRDNWCIGYTPEYTVGVWAGNFENQPMKNISGVSGAGPIFHRSLVRVQGATLPATSAIPAEVQVVLVDPRTGKILPKGADHTFSVHEYTMPSRPHSIAAAADYDEKGRALLPPLYRDWYQSNQNHRRQELALNETVENIQPLKILRPKNHSTILLDPEIPGNNSDLKLLTNLPDFVSWACDTLEIHGTTAHLTPGTHRLIATDTRSDTQHEITIIVRKL